MPPTKKYAHECVFKYTLLWQQISILQHPGKLSSASLITVEETYTHANAIVLQASGETFQFYARVSNDGNKLNVGSCFTHSL